MMMLRATALLGALTLAAGHGAVVKPRPRNSVDRDLAPWNGTTVKTPSVESMTGLCPSVDENGKVSGQNGQSCFWVRRVLAALRPSRNLEAVLLILPWCACFIRIVLQRVRCGMRHLRRQFSRPHPQLRG